MIETAPIKQADPGTQPIEAAEPETNKPSPTPFKFSPVVRSEPFSTTPIGSPAKPSTTFNSGAETLQTPFSITKADRVLGAPPSKILKEPEVPQRKPIDKDQLVQHLCRIGLVQKDGILDMFVAAKVNSLCNEVYKAFQTSRLNSRIGKFCALVLEYQLT